MIAKVSGAKRTRQSLPRSPYVLLLTAWLAGSMLLARHAFALWSGAGQDGLRGFGLALLLGVVLVSQSIALFYLLGFVAKSVHYLFARIDTLRADRPPGQSPSVAVLYLTAADFDAVALDSLLRLEGGGERLLIVHDDGSDEATRASIERFLDNHPCGPLWQTAVWHRPQRVGGKAGAVNWVLERLGTRWDLLLLCDSDSIALDRKALVHGSVPFSEEDVAVVQFRNVGFQDSEESPFQVRLTQAIDVFDAFARPQATWGYLPFFGHNALIRIEDLRRLGGLTPGFFSDDLDLSVRLTLSGKKIIYLPEVSFAERHPSDWLGFRKRARKWALGCMQVIRAQLARVLTQPGVPLAHRVGMIEFMSFYPAQAILVLGLAVRQLLLPWLLPHYSADPFDLVAGAAVMCALLAPTFAWSVRARKIHEWPGLAWSCVLVYGGSILSTVAGVLDGLSTRERPWIPTNLAVRRPTVPRQSLLEACFGLALIAVPWWFQDSVLALPATYLFAAPFLFAPLTAARYRGAAPGSIEQPAAERRIPEHAASVGLVLITAGTMLLSAGTAWAGPLTVKGGRLLEGSRPFQLRGVHYSPWGPRTGPDGRSPFPSAARVERDLKMIRELGANGIVVSEAPGWMVERAHRHDLLTLYAFNIAWHDTSRIVFERRADQIIAAVDTLRSRRGIAIWILGHEVPAWVVKQLGRQQVERRLAALASRVRQHDPDHLLAHANWPPTRDLDLSAFDLACFNLYPAWPNEVAVKGYGPYLREVITPLARGRPLLITEFGINSLEASEERQAKVLQDCWNEIASSNTAGGVVFEWSDEWWKNFDNPISSEDYWQRAYAPDDAEKHDRDPEEYYGIVRVDRSPKPALTAVRAMWVEPRRSSLPWITLGALAALTWAVLAMKPRRRRSKAVAGAGVVILVMSVLLPSRAAATSPTWTSTAILSGQRADDQFGWALAAVGDVDLDGWNDVGVAARFFQVGPDTAAGAVYLYAGHVPAAGAFRRLEGLTPNEHFGEGLCGGLDIDGDGADDVAVGAPLRTVEGRSSAGAVDVFRGGLLGARWVTLGGESANDWFGQSVALGDLDGDGRAEIIVGAPYNDRAASAAGAVFIYRGGTSPPSAPWRILVGEAANDHFGWSVAFLGDMDGDGFGDIAVGARLHGSGALGGAGKVYRYLGGPGMDALADGSWVGEFRDDWFGNSVAGPGDIDGGGKGDLLVGAPYNDRGGSAAGAAYLFRGENGPGAAPAVIYVGEAANAQFGWSVAGAGDVDGDGRRDLTVGARLQPVGFQQAVGRAYVFRGGTPFSPAPWIMAQGEAADDWFGNCVAGTTEYFLGDCSSLVAGAPYNDAAGSAAGRAYVLGACSSTVGVGPPMSVGSLHVYPNPSHGAFVIQWFASEPEVPRIEVVDVLGRTVRSLTRHRTSGPNQIAWDGRDEDQRPVVSGLYLIRARYDHHEEVARVLMVR